ncbi:MAG: multimeric flavodoxin WrbA [Marinobacter maritimus]|jgi:multimeric flavodoxin WrbA|uniref:flavodoxin family protein n=1 Tax=Marinobacter maritimus TaxID=277961 RepID=UPI0011AAFEA0|nr:flavodoxin family protein [Marinobacter maritimus]|tara:strand:+ start:180 stop:650 length:471 start_codon:yes stop_codon:yes gene_type:complete
MDRKKKLLIVSHAPSPNTLTLRNAVAQGADHEDIENVEVTVLAPLDAGPDDVLACDAIILGTTENLGYMSGALKDFFDRSYYPCLEKTQGLPFAYYIRAGHDGTGTQRAIESITTGLRWKVVQQPLLCRGEYRDEFEDQCRELGMYVAASLDAGLF